MDIDPPQPVDIYFAPSAGGVEHSFGSDAVAGHHDIQLSFLKPGYRYTWRAVGRDDPSLEFLGYLRAGNLIDGCSVQGNFSGTSSASYFVANSPCSGRNSSGTGLNGAMVIVDGDGDVVWCDQFLNSPNQHQVLGFSFTEDQTILTTGSDGSVRERDLQGNELLHLQRGVEFTGQNHHSAYRWNGLTYVLVHETETFWGTSFMMDAFLVFDGTTQVAEWHLSDHHTPPQSAVPAGGTGTAVVDYSHANSMWIDDQGVMLLSYRHQSAVMAVVADPLAPDFGDVLWVMSSSQSDIPSDFVLTTSAGLPAEFEMQHDPHFLPNGQLALLDNCPRAAGHGSCNGGQPSRVLHLDVDELSGTADIQMSYSMGSVCMFQGGAQHTVIGNPVGTCAPTKSAKEFDRTSGAIVWNGSLQCTAGTVGYYVTRFVPWEGPW